MKKLKTILPIFLISLFVFIGNVKALTNFTTQNIRGIELYLQNNPNKSVNDFRKEVLDNFIFPNEEYQKEKYIILLAPFSSYSNNLTIYYLSSDFKQNIAYGNEALYFRNANQGNFYICYNLINIDSNGNITAVTSNEWVCTEQNTWFSFMSNGGGYYIISTNYEYFKYDLPTWARDSFSIDNGEEYIFQQSNIPINFTNGDTYNFKVNDYFLNPIPTIQPPYNTYHNGYTETTFLIDNYTEKSNVNGYFIRIINNNNGNVQGIAPDYGNPDREITLTSYENTNYTIQIYDREYNIIQEYSINANINYETNTNFSIEINNIDNNTREVFYKYIISDTNQNYTCYHSINNNTFIQDLDCTDTSTVYYNLTMPNNGNLAFKIEDNNGNIVYEYDQNIVFNVSDPYISFQDNFDNNYLNLNILINRYQDNDIVEYSINNSNFIQANLEDYSITQNIKNFYINNLNNNDIIIVRIRRNNEIITYAKYKANYLKYSNNSEEDYNINNIFEKINIENINNELREYIKNFGNLIINSKIGNLLLLQTFCLIIILIIKMIRN